MDGATVSLKGPGKTDVKKFTYDFSYWSHDGFNARDDGYNEKTSDQYVDQVKVFDDLGKGLLANAWDGYNCTIFAYGQTGSGKSYSIMGHGANLGLVPRTCEQLFRDIENRMESGVNYEVTFSMLEIYNEQARDLLNKEKPPPGGLKVRECAKRGFYLEDLKTVPVGSYSDIQHWMNEGDRQRTIAATKMNKTSSRAHTIVTITFVQNNISSKETKRSTINLVDLAGSERQKQTEAKGDRFKEAKHINKSLMTLGSVIEALCKTARGVKTHVRYRDSILTKLLKNALGGNSKSVMIAAISPDNENYDQTLSTLKYADRAKAIRTAAKVNTEATDKRIKELIEEKEKLLLELENALTAKDNRYTEDDIKKLQEEKEREIQRYKEHMDDREAAWQKELLDARKEMEELQAMEKRLEEERCIPHFSNLNEDPALSGKLIYIAKAEESVVGNGKDKTNPEIVLNGPGMAKTHAKVTNNGGKVKLTPLDGLVLHNGVELKETVQLHHEDRIRFGSNNLVVFIHPQEASELQAKGKHPREVTYEFAQNEIAKHSGVQVSDEDPMLLEDVLTILQLVQDVNAMANDMSKPVDFSVRLLSAKQRGLDGGRTEVYVKVQDLDTGNVFLWDKNKFLIRQVHMQQTYQNFEEGGSPEPDDKEADPFWEPHDTDVIVGVASVQLNYLSHMLEFQDESLRVIDYKVKQSGFLKVALVPCDSQGNEQVELCVEDPMDLVNKPMAFRIKVQQAMNLPERIAQSWCQYKFYEDMEYTRSRTQPGRNPVFNHDKLYRFPREDVSHRFIDYLKEKSLSIEIWGKQGDRATTGGRPATHRQCKVRVPRSQSLLQDDRKMTETTAQQLQKKLDRIQTLVDKEQRKSHMVEAIKKILQEPANAGNGDT